MITARNILDNQEMIEYHRDELSYHRDELALLCQEIEHHERMIQRHIQELRELYGAA